MQSGVYKEFIGKLISESQKMVLGNGLHERTQMGPLISEHHLTKVQGFVDRAVLAGAKVLLGGRRMCGGSLDGSPFYPPTIIEVEDNSLEIVQEEVFGPVVVVKKFESVDEGVELRVC